MIVSSITPVKVIHGTYKKITTGDSGIEEILLEDYIRSHKKIDIVNCRIGRSHDVLKYIQEEIFPNYRFNRFSALLAGLPLPNI